MLNSEVLKNTIKNDMISKGFEITEWNEKFIQCLSDSIIQHFVSSAQINTIVNVTTPAGPGTGTGVGSIS